ncbi:GNAT family N-acetyltransferase [Legionella jordanis]|nr:GNAT family N-acetyltransferase [Legionella jordanis]
MKNDLARVQITDSISDELAQRMNDDLIAYEQEHGVDVNYKRFSFILYNGNDKACAVINAYTAFAEIYIDDLWVDSEHRNCGYGSTLLQALEEHFKGKGFNNINLCTSAFQAHEFYLKCGFIPEFTRINSQNPKLSKTFFVKFFNEEHEMQGIISKSI